jgi:hypothetical protein
MGSVGRAGIPVVALLPAPDAAWTDGKATEMNEQAVVKSEQAVVMDGKGVGIDGQLVVNCDLVSSYLGPGDPALEGWGGMAPPPFVLSVKCPPAGCRFVSERQNPSPITGHPVQAGVKCPFASLSLSR